MKFVDSGDPDILQIRRGGGSLMIPGLPFFLGGLYVVGSALWGPFSQGQEIPWFVTAIFGSIFVAVGAALAFGRSGMIIDRRKGTIVRWYGLLVPMKKTTDLLEYHDHVTIRKELRRCQNSIYYAYPVVLKGSHGGSAGIDLADHPRNYPPMDYPQARRIAGEITAFLKLPLVDTTSGKEVIREPDELNESIRERAKRTKERVQAFDPPPDMRARVQEELGALIIEIPPQKLTIEHYRRMAIIVAIGAVAEIVVYCVNNLRLLKSHDLIVYAPVGIFILLFAISVILLQRGRSLRITASRDLLRVEERYSIRRKVTEIPVDQLEDFVMGDANLPIGVSRTPDGRYQAEGVPVSPGNSGGYSDQQVMGGTKLYGKLSLFFNPPGPSITASGNKATVNFGKGLREDELRYLYALIKKKITE